MKWSDFDTNKNAFPKTIRIIVDWLWFVSERWDNIEDKNKFIEQGLQPLITGSFRNPSIINGKLSYPSPALGTLLRNLGFIDDNFNLSQLVGFLAQGKLTIEEYSLIILSKQRGWINNVPVVNFLVLLCIYLRANNYCDISIDMLEKLSKVDGYSLNPTNSQDSNRNDMLYNYIKSIGLFDEIEVSNTRYLKIKPEAIEIIDFIADHEQNIAVDQRTIKQDRYEYYGDLSGGIFQLKNQKFPTNWSLFYPNLFNQQNNYYNYLHINPSLFRGSLEPVILFGPPGTGKTHSLQTKYLHLFPKEARFFTTFHQSFSYEEFVEGLKPTLNTTGNDISYRIEEGILFKACNLAAQRAGFASLKDAISATPLERKRAFDAARMNNNLVILCIDEINRGNVAAIFGDLISLIETDKRLGNENELILTLPYSKNEFGVPSNLLIVGTMNTADRSIQLLDSALRRRFKFLELLPDYEKVANPLARNILNSINSRIRALLNKDSQIGHSYFYHIPENSPNEATLILKALVNKIIPLLEEYFYNDYSKIKFVLSENDNTPNSFFKKDKDASMVFNIFCRESLSSFDERDDFYEINPDIKNASDDESKAKLFIERWSSTNNTVDTEKIPYGI